MASRDAAALTYSTASEMSADNLHLRRNFTFCNSKFFLAKTVYCHCLWIDLQHVCKTVGQRGPDRVTQWFNNFVLNIQELIIYFNRPYRNAL